MRISNIETFIVDAGWRPGDLSKWKRMKVLPDGESVVMEDRLKE